ncbi:M24 family metallopeptidase [Pedobacter alpinus]|uniref:M24 family metallopeptidase n=1 Tax=Pedobacter alpinus TaxID=1590643 RepID=A0ABW5TMY0_9SPHI
MKRKEFLGLSALAATAGLTLGFTQLNNHKEKTYSQEIEKLKLTISDAEPITVKERENRIAKAQRLLIENKIGALILDSGTSLNYFTGVKWGQSERAMLAIIPAKGTVKYICPAFELDRLKERIIIGNDVRVWEEDENPFRLVAHIFKELGIKAGDIGLEKKVRFFIMDGIKKEAPHLNYVSGDPISVACRIIKSEAEIKLMQKANDITLAAIKIGVSKLQEGMKQSQLAAIIMKAQNDLGGNADFALCLFGQSSAYPHGSKQAPTLKTGDIVLMDCGCTVESYNSDISRTVVFGNSPSKRQEEIWNLEKKAQLAGFEAAKVGATCEAVDFAARKVLIDAGFGPGYKLPGLPHRTGHGIGMDGHEWRNMVKGNKKLLEPGMCFSIEPTISIIGEFGIRFEDCVYMTADGPQWFSQPSKSINEPFG